MKKILLIAAVSMTTLGFAQEVQETFNGTRVINGHSTETLEARILQFRIEHRFGDMAGANGGVQQFFGFDQAADIRFAFEYGITKDLMVGLGRSKGTGAPYRSLVDMFVKYKILAQEKGKMPVSLTVLGSGTATYMQASSDLTQVTSFPEFAHRLAYNSQLLVSRKFGESVSAQLMPTYVHRNFVDIDDVNGMFAIGGALHWKITKTIGLSAEYYHAIHDSGVRTTNTNSLGFAFEWITNGHTFKLNVTNSRGFNETQFIPYTYSSWKDGEFRLGFTISRNFKL
ncbi:MAG: DUF5777 family beta-barrel protein [Crocinitomicaceae bacterium]|nr:DUF5777 family beta-barrel protein [Crocinitomicaceae bacterium]MDG1658057.1 DUF5777 family beta-barrel protein [Crocinitomicaceae bacterium]MDG2441354.1 DUF5777 family beta-barrel protein [Crocinitomicaceae bacterium]